MVVAFLVSSSSFKVIFQFSNFCFMQNAFNVRGLSRKKLQRLKSKNMDLLQHGQLDIPDRTWKPVQPLTLFRVQGSDLLSPQQVG